MFCVFYSQYRIGSFDEYTAHIDEVTPASVALVFGGGVLPDGTMSDVLEDRVIASIELYQQGKVQKVLMTGDNGSNNYDEVTHMKQYAVAHGVREEDVVLDYAGFRTYDSCYRARDIFGLTDVIAVSQAFHLPRILYICNSLGVHTTGFVADKQAYVPATWWKVREFLARFKAWYQVEITHPLPRFLGEKEPIVL